MRVQITPGEVGALILANRTGAVVRVRLVATFCNRARINSLRVEFSRSSQQTKIELPVNDDFLAKRPIFT
jgi:hypothetical protein